MPEEATTVNLQVPISELRYWSEEDAKWKLENGIYEMHIGASSRDIKFSQNIDIVK